LKWNDGFTDRIIYHFVGTALVVLCFNREASGEIQRKEWPTRFATGNDESGTYLQVWTRVKSK
jgi:hypothetical protein